MRNTRHLRRATRRFQRRPLLRVFERRTLLSTVTENLTAGILTVTGSDDADTISVRNAGTNVVVDYVTRHNGVQIDSGTFTEKASSVNLVKIDGGPVDSTLDASAYSGPVTLDGGGGNDTLIVGSGDATVIGGSGMSTLIASGDTNFTLTNTSLIGLGTDALTSIKNATLTATGSDPHTLDASGFSGTVTLNGGAGDNTLIGGTGSGTLNGGLGMNTVVESGDVDFKLTDTSLVGRGTDTLTSIQNAVLTETGSDPHTLDASGFSGSVTMTGGAGNDTFLGGSGAGVFHGGTGIDTFVLKDPTDPTQKPSGALDTVSGVSGADVVQIGQNQIVEPFLDTWVADGEEGGTLGIPTEDQEPGTGNVTSQRFSKGLIYESAATGTLVVPFDLTTAELSLFDPSYGPVRDNLLRNFFYNGFVAQRTYTTGTAPNLVQNMVFSDQTKDMGHTLMTFAQEAAILQHGGFDPTPAENVVSIILNAFNQLENQAVSSLYGPGAVTPGLFVRDYVANNPVGDPLRQGIPAAYTISSDYMGSEATGGNPPGGDDVMSADQVTFMMDGWWAVTHYSTNPASVAEAKQQATDVMNYLISQNYYLTHVGAATISQSRGDARLPAAFLSNLADAVTGDDFFLDPDNSIYIGTISKDDLIQAIVNTVNGVLDAATVGLNEAYIKYFHDNPGQDVANALSSKLPAEIPVDLPVAVEDAILETILKANPAGLTTLAEAFATQSINRPSSSPPQSRRSYRASSSPCRPGSPKAARRWTGPRAIPKSPSRPPA